MKSLKLKLFVLIAAVASLGLYSFNFSNAAVQDEIAKRQQQIEELQRQIEDYQNQIASSQTQSKTLENEIAKLNAQIKSITLTIKSLELSIAQTSDELNTTESQINDAEDKISKHRDALAQYLRIAYKSDQETLTEILLKNNNLSDFFTNLNNIRVNQENLRTIIDSIRDLKAQLEDKQGQLEDKRTEYERMRNLQAIEQSSLNQNKSSVNKILKDTKGQESKYQDLVKKTQKDLEALRAQITYLEQNGVTAEEAVKYGQLAAISTGIRPAFLIAELEIESALGQNVGKCNREGDPPSKSYKAVMKPTRDIEPFLAIVGELGLNPDTTPVSCPQYVNGVRYGWGGAMGPAQFIPSTWMGYRDEVSRIVGRPANPWTIEDAFTAAAVKLARGGATSQTRAGEIAASKAYYSGNSRCSTVSCNSYANRVQAKAAEIEQNL